MCIFCVINSFIGSDYCSLINRRMTVDEPEFWLESNCQLVSLVSSWNGNLKLEYNDLSQPVHADSTQATDDHQPVQGTSTKLPIQQPRWGRLHTKQKKVKCLWLDPLILCLRLSRSSFEEHFYYFYFCLVVYEASSAFHKTSSRGMQSHQDYSL